MHSLRKMNNYDSIRKLVTMNLLKISCYDSPEMMTLLEIEII